MIKNLNYRSSRNNIILFYSSKYQIFPLPSLASIPFRGLSPLGERVFDRVIELRVDGVLFKY